MVSARIMRVRSLVTARLLCVYSAPAAYLLRGRPVFTCFFSRFLRVYCVSAASLMFAYSAFLARRLRVCCSFSACSPCVCFAFAVWRLRINRAFSASLLRVHRVVPVSLLRVSRMFSASTVCSQCADFVCPERFRASVVRPQCCGCAFAVWFRRVRCVCAVW